MAAEDAKVGFEATASSVKDIFSTLNAAYDGKKDRKALIIASARGLRVSVVNQEQSLYSVAYLPEGMFTKYACAPAAGSGDVRLKVSLHTILQCMTIFGGGAKLESTMMRLSFSYETALVNLSLHESKCTTECEIATYDVGDEDSMDASMSIGEQFRAEATAAQVSVQADVLRECFGEILGVAGAARVKMRVSNRAPYFRLSTAGTSGSCSVDLPRGSDAVTAHTVTPKGAGQDDGEAAGELSVTSEFLAPLIEQAVRPLASSSTAFLRINHDGLLSINHRIAVQCEAQVYVSVVVMPVSYEGEEDEEDDDAGPGLASSPGRGHDSSLTRDVSVSRAHDAAAQATITLMRESHKQSIARVRADAEAERDADVMRMASAANRRVYGRPFVGEEGAEGEEEEEEEEGAAEEEDGEPPGKVARGGGRARGGGGSSAGRGAGISRAGATASDSDEGSSGGEAAGGAAGARGGGLEAAEGEEEAEARALVERSFRGRRRRQPRKGPAARARPAGGVVVEDEDA